MVSSPGPCALSRGRSPEAFFLVFRLEYEVAKACKSYIIRKELSNEYALANFASIQPRTGFSNFANSFQEKKNS